MQTQTYELNFGPQHPSTHGVLRVVLELDGETVVKATPVIGYLHRGIEKICENRTYVQTIPFTDRLDYLAGMGNNLGISQAIEKLMGVEVPERAEYIRVIMCELSRIASHMICCGSLVQDLGGVTGFVFFIRDREDILELFNRACGARMTFNYIRPGGVAQDLPEGWVAQCRRFLADFKGMMDTYHKLVVGNEIFQLRMKGIAPLSAERAIAMSATGGVLRASGVDYDVRKADPYGIYDRFDFKVPLGSKGDNWDRFMVRMEEMEQSARIIEQALDQLPEGPIMAKVPKAIKPPAGEVYHRIENAKGEIGFYVVSDGTLKPYRWHARRAAMVNLQLMDELCRGFKIGDVVAILGTLDPVLGEVDC
ncbi:NADH-quinone oxidoreductase subunit D [Heliobacterium gestii]|uniref:NADH-quinone oxidoreductase subunit D n=1 Tax=Heliomicrobium gestii TaxID=2699 RepID=A0A845LA34_HELGE|nr:NADH-quinone oxidoreductase subunit D [Heliomicrobium gestii]MBM7867073.1 NADH-quinone oxidoreductase subunit D [Heliomicrobium gestii]MZP43512.1 NADH-quinone oxidoreductase subunit D [Heliomicrobium gestii]